MNYYLLFQGAGAQPAAGGGGGVRDQVFAQFGALQLQAIRALDAGAGALVSELAAPVAAFDGRAENLESAHLQRVKVEPQQTPVLLPQPSTRPPPLIHL